MMFVWKVKLICFGICSRYFHLSLQMVGIGTSDVNLDKYRHTFCSLLGKDSDSWGLSYTGKTNTNVYMGCVAEVAHQQQLTYYSVCVYMHSARVVCIQRPIYNHCSCVC